MLEDPISKNDVLGLVSRDVRVPPALQRMAQLLGDLHYLKRIALEEDRRPRSRLKIGSTLADVPGFFAGDVQERQDAVIVEAFGEEEAGEEGAEGET